MEDDAGDIGQISDGDTLPPGTAGASPGIFGGATIIDPNTIGRRGDGGRSRPASDGGSFDGGNNGDSAGDTNGSGDLGPFGHGFFANGKPRKRAPRTGAGAATGVASSKTQRKALPLEPSTVEFYLYAIHKGVSSFAEYGVPQNERVIPLEHDDARKLSVAVCNAAKHFPIFQQSQKALDVGALIATAAAIYGPMIWLYMQRQTRNSAGNPTPQQDNVFPFSTGA